MIKFLENFPEKERRTGLDIDYVIVSKTDWERTRSAIAFGRVKVVGNELVSNSNFLFEKGDKVLYGDNVLTIVGRIDWKRYENDYLIAPMEKKGEKSMLIQVPESGLQKVK